MAFTAGSVAQNEIPIRSITTAAIDREVIIEGTVTGYSPSSYERQPHRFTVVDNSGTITVVMWNDVYSQLLPAPIEGSRVTIRGTVGEYRGELQIQVAEPRNLVTSAGGEAPPPMPTLDSEPTPLSTITAARGGEFVCVVGQIDSIRRSTSDSAPNVLSIRDSTGTGQVVIWPDDFSHIRPQPAQGVPIRVVGEIRDFRGTTQIYCRDSSLVLVGQGALQVASTPSAAALAPSITSTGEIAWIEDIASAQGRARQSDRPMLLYAHTELSNTCQELEANVLTEESVIEAIGATIPLKLNMREHTEDAHRFSVFTVPTLVVFNPNGQELNRLTGDISAGDVTGMIEQVMSDEAAPRPAQAAAVAPPPAQTPPPTMSITPIASVSQSMVGRTVIVEGTVTNVREAWNERAPNTVTLSDGNSSISVVAWSDVWNSLQRRPQSGDRVRVRGEVSLYQQRNELQIRMDAILFAR